MKTYISSIIKFVGEADFSYIHNWLSLRQLCHYFAAQNPCAQTHMQKTVEAALRSNPTVRDTRVCMWVA